MEKRVLVISSQTAFGELIRISLAENNEYDVQVAVNLADLQAIVSQILPDLLMVDVDLSDQNWISAIGQMQINFPAMKTIVFLSGNVTQSAIEQQINVDSFVDKPFYLPKFLKEVQILLTIEEYKGEVDLQNSHPVVFTQNLEELRLSLEYLLNKFDAKQLIYFIDSLPYANTGSLGDFVTLDIGSFLQSSREFPQHSDLIRYKRFIGDSIKYLIYIRSLSEKNKFVMIFDSQIPLDKAKSQINSASKFLQDPDYYRTMENGEMPKMAEIDSPRREIISDLSSKIIDETELTLKPDSEDSQYFGENEMLTLDALVAGSFENQDDNTKEFEPPVQHENTPVEQQDVAKEGSFPDSGFLTHDFLSDWITEFENLESKSNQEETTSEIDNSPVSIDQKMEIESPEETVSLVESSAAIKEIAAQVLPDQEMMDNPNLTPEKVNLFSDITFPWEEAEKKVEMADSFEEPIKINELADETNPINLEDSYISMGSNEEENNRKENNFEFDQVASLSNQPDEPTLRNEIQTLASERISIPLEFDDDPLGKTQPRKIPDLDASEISLPVAQSVGFVRLSYTFLLIPRFPNHYLSGNFAKKMGEWIPNLCLAFGWRLDRMTIRPLYLLWSITAPPSVAPNKIIAKIRKETSKRISTYFPGYFQDNPSNDFWAPGYLLITENYSPSKAIISDYIKQTRRYQGLSVTPRI